MEVGSGLALLGSAKLIEKLLGPTCEYLGQNLQQLTKNLFKNVSIKILQPLFPSVSIC